MTEAGSESNQTPGSNQQSDLRSKPKQTFYLIKFGSIALLMMSLFPLLSSYSSVFELFSHFRLQLLIVSLIVAVLLIVYKCRMYLIPIVVATVLNGAAIYPLYFGASETVAEANFRLLTLNVSVTNSDFERVQACIKESDADVICMQELGPEMNNYLSKNLKDYPYRLTDPRTDPFGIGIFSRHYVTSQNVIPSPSTTRTDAEAQRTKDTINSLMVGITVGDREVKVISTHPPPPLRPNFFEWRNRQLEFLSTMAAASNEPFIIAGDLNCTPYSPFFAKTLEKGNLKDSEIGFGIQASWPTDMLPLLIPIDHVLYKGPMLIVDRRLGLSTGSDHTPVVVSFRVADARR